MSDNRTSHIRLTSHGQTGAQGRLPIHWDAPTASARGPVIAAVSAGPDRNAIGAYGGAYSIYRALAISAGVLSPGVRPELTDTQPVVPIGPHPQWSEPGRIVSLDPWGARVSEDFGDALAAGLDIRPSIAVTRARIQLPEIRQAIAAGRLKVDGEVVHAAGDVAVTKAAIDAVWHLPGIASRFGVDERSLRRTLFEQTGGMYPELVTRPDLCVFLPPIGGASLYIFGDPSRLDVANVLARAEVQKVQPVRARLEGVEGLPGDVDRGPGRQTSARCQRVVEFHAKASGMAYAEQLVAGVA